MSTRKKALYLCSITSMEWKNKTKGGILKTPASQSNPKCKFPLRRHSLHER